MQPFVERVERTWAWWLFGIALVVRIAFLLGSDNNDGDAFARVLLSRKVASEGTWVPTDVWLPAHFWILALPCWLGWTGQLALRLLTAVAGAATIPAVYVLVRHLSDRTTALVIGALLALNPLHIRLSVLTVSEAFFLCFLTLAFLAFDRYRDQGGLPWMLMGSLCLNLACGMRLEGWLFLPVLLLVSLGTQGDLLRWAKDARRRRGVAFVAASSVFALWWAIYSYLTFGDPAHVATLTQGTNLADAVYQGSPWWYTLAFWPVLLMLTLGPLLLGLGMKAFWTGLSAPRRSWSLLFAMILIVYYIQNFRSALITQARYGMLLAWLLLLCVGTYEAQTVRRTCRWLIAHAAVWLLVVWGVAEVPAGIVSSKFGSISPRPRFAPAVRAIDDWLRGAAAGAPLAIGPLEGAYGPWMSSFDKWYPVNRVEVVRSPADLEAVIRGAGRAGYWVVDAERTKKEGGVWQSVMGAAGMTQRLSSGRFVVYEWTSPAAFERVWSEPPQCHVPMATDRASREPGTPTPSQTPVM